MANQRLECPECDSIIRPARSVEPGKKVRCPRCEAVFRVPEAGRLTENEPRRKPPRRESAPREREEDDFDFDEPRARPSRRSRSRRKAHSGGSSLKWLWLSLGGVGVAAVIGLVLYLVLSGPSDSDKVTEENFAKIKGTMTLDEVEDILGSGSKTSRKELEEELLSDIQKEMRFPKSGSLEVPMKELMAGMDRGMILLNAQMCGVEKWYEWKNDDFHVYVGLRDDSEGTPRVTWSAWVRKSGSGKSAKFESKIGVSINARTDLGKLAKERDEFEKMTRDSKWKKGAAAKKAILGRWKKTSKISQHEYEFKSDGTYRKKDAFEEFVGNYRFTNNDHVEITIPGAHLFPPSQRDKKITYRVLVSDDELRLLQDQSKPGAGLTYKRIN